MTTEYIPNEELNNAITESNNDEPEISDFERLVAERYESAPDGVSGSSNSVEQQGEETEARAADLPPESDDWEFSPGRRLSKETAQAYYEFEEFLNANPEIAEAIQQAVVGSQEVTQPTTTDTPTPDSQLQIPEELDLDNPAVQYLVSQLEENQKQLNQAMEAIRRHDTVLNTQTEATTESIVNRAVASFKQERQLTDDQMDGLKSVTANMNVMDSLLSPIDPISGKPRKVDPLAAVEKALDIAYWSIPEYRDKEIARQQQIVRDDNSRKQKLSSLGGSSGSTPREMPQPQTKEELQQAMIREVAEAIGVPPSS